MIKREGSKYCVYDSKGQKKLGTHDTKDEAESQIKAIEASKAKRRALDEMGGY